MTVPLAEVVGCLLVATAGPNGVTAEPSPAPLLFVEAQTGCLVERGVHDALAAVVDRHQGAEALTVTAADVRATKGIIVTLRVVTPAGAVILDRRFDLAPQDCASSPQLLATVLGSFLRDFPRSEWGVGKPSVERPEAPPAVPVLVEHDASQLGGLVFLALAGRFPPAGAGLEAGAAIDVGSSRHRLIGSAAVRVGSPQTLGAGHFLDATTLLGVGWRYGAESWLLRAEIRAGGILVAGYGFDTNRNVWLPWVEGQASVLWSVGPALLGPEVGVSPLRHDVTTSGGSSGQIPWLRLGAVAAWPIWADKI